MTLGDRMDDAGGQLRSATAEEATASAQGSPRSTGEQLFDAMTNAEQDEAFGPEIAAALRSGEIKLADLVARSPMENQPDFITQASPVDLGLKPKD